MQRPPCALFLLAPILCTLQLLCLVRDVLCCVLRLTVNFSWSTTNSTLAATPGGPSDSESELATQDWNNLSSRGFELQRKLLFSGKIRVSMTSRKKSMLGSYIRLVLAFPGFENCVLVQAAGKPTLYHAVNIFSEIYCLVLRFYDHLPRVLALRDGGVEVREIQRQLQGFRQTPASARAELVRCDATFMQASCCPSSRHCQCYRRRQTLQEHIDRSLNVVVFSRTYRAIPARRPAMTAERLLSSTR